MMMKRFKNLKLDEDYVYFDDEKSLSFRKCNSEELENVLNDLNDKVSVMEKSLNDMGYRLIYDEEEGWSVL